MSRGAKDAKLADDTPKADVVDDAPKQKIDSNEIPNELLNEPKELRVIRRAKRHSKDAESIDANAVKPSFTNRQRRPRNRHRRGKLGEPKKGSISFKNIIIAIYF